MAFEVVNTTAEINKQGQATVWRLPNVLTATDIATTIATTPPVTTIGSVYQYRMPPGNIALAQLLYGSRSWAAAEGAYVVARQNDIVNVFQQPSSTTIVYSQSDNLNSNAWPAYSVAGVNAPSTPSDIHAPYDLSGVHFTGLSYATTLTVNIRWLLERMPGTQESDLVVLATPSALYDPLALELYTRTISDMPPGVMLKENPLGEWFRSAMSKVADLAPMVGGALNTILPGSQIVGNLVGGGARYLSRPKMPSTASTNMDDGIQRIVEIQSPTKRVQLPAGRTIKYKKTQSKLKKKSK